MTPQPSGLGSPVPKVDADTASTTPSNPLTKAAKAPLNELRAWNTKNLALRLASDLAAGFGAAVMVAPVVTVIDKVRNCA